MNKLVLSGTATYKTCNSDSDCVYLLPGSTTTTTISGSCVCVPQANLKMCKYGGAESVVLNSVYTARNISQRPMYNATVFNASLINIDNELRL